MRITRQVARHILAPLKRGSLDYANMFATGVYVGVSTRGGGGGVQARFLFAIYLAKYVVPDEESAALQQADVSGRPFDSVAKK